VVRSERQIGRRVEHQADRGRLARRQRPERVGAGHPHPTDARQFDGHRARGGPARVGHDELDHPPLAANHALRQSPRPLQHRHEALDLRADRHVDRDALGRGHAEVPGVVRRGTGGLDLVGVRHGARARQDRVAQVKADLDPLRNVLRGDREALQGHVAQVPQLHRAGHKVADEHRVLDDPRVGRQAQDDETVLRRVGPDLRMAGGDLVESGLASQRLEGRLELAQGARHGRQCPAGALVQDAHRHGLEGGRIARVDLRRHATQQDRRAGQHLAHVGRDAGLVRRHDLQQVRRERQVVILDRLAHLVQRVHDNHHVERAQEVRGVERGVPLVRLAGGQRRVVHERAEQALGVELAVRRVVDPFLPGAAGVGEALVADGPRDLKRAVRQHRRRHRQGHHAQVGQVCVRHVERGGAGVEAGGRGADGHGLVAVHDAVHDAGNDEVDPRLAGRDDHLDGDGGLAHIAGRERDGDRLAGVGGVPRDGRHDGPVLGQQGSIEADREGRPVVIQDVERIAGLAHAEGFARVRVGRTDGEDGRLHPVDQVVVDRRDGEPRLGRARRDEDRLQGPGRRHVARLHEHRQRRVGDQVAGHGGPGRRAEGALDDRGGLDVQAQTDRVVIDQAERGLGLAVSGGHHQDGHLGIGLDQGVLGQDDFERGGGLAARHEETIGDRDPSTGRLEDLDGQVADRGRVRGHGGHHRAAFDGLVHRQRDTDGRLIGVEHIEADLPGQDEPVADAVLIEVVGVAVLGVGLGEDHDRPEAVDHAVVERRDREGGRPLTGLKGHRGGYRNLGRVRTAPAAQRGEIDDERLVDGAAAADEGLDRRPRLFNLPDRHLEGQFQRHRERL